MQAGEEHLRNIFEHIPIGIVECTLDGRIVDVNEVFCGIVGFERAELLGRHLEDLIYQADFAVEVSLQDKLVSGQVALYELEKRYIRKDGEAIWVRITRSLVRDPQGVAHTVSTVLDISERKRYESQLQMQAYLLANVQDAIISTNARLEITSWNQAAEKLYGWKAEEVLGRVMAEVVRSEMTPERRAELVREAEAAGRTVSETTHHHRDGHPIRVESSSSALRASGDRVTGYVVVVRDVTARRQAEEELRARTEEMEALLKVSPIAFFIAHDPACTRISGNPAGYRLVHMPDDSERNISKSAPAQERPTYRVFRGEEELGPDDLPMQMAARLGVEIHEESLELRFEDGSHAYIYAYACPLFDAAGRTRGAIAAMLNITRRQEAEEALRELNLRLEDRVRRRTLALEQANKALRESEATARLLLDNDPDAVVIADENGIIVHANRRLETLFGYRPGEIMGMPVETLIPKRYHEQHLGHRRDFREHGGQRSMGVARRVVGQHREGMEFPVDVVLTPIPDIPGWDVMVTIRDSRDRQRIEDALQESRSRLQALTQRLVEVQEQERRAMARELHDQVGQSLSALKMILSTVGDELPGEEGQPARERLQDAVDVTSEMISLVRSMMNELRPPILDEYGLEAALDAYISQYRERYGVDVVLAGPSSPLPRLGSGIETSLLRIAQEALTNAARHSGAKRITVRLERAGNAISLSVEDNGRGIQSWESANRGGVHGLTTMRERAEAFGGELRIRSEPRVGTRIEARIPVPAREEAALQGDG
jgi:two-component system sensor kinase